MRIGPLGVPELLIILLVIMLIFGAKRLPEIGSSLGKGIRTFKSAVTGEDDKEATGSETTTSSDKDRL
jgi:sec-independent protein translocase protein TatA